MTNPIFKAENSNKYIFFCYKIANWNSNSSIHCGNLYVYQASFPMTHKNEIFMKKPN